MTAALRGSCDRWLARLSWTLQGRGNALRRPVDRKEGRLITGLLVIFLLASPLARFSALICPMRPASGICTLSDPGVR